MTSELTIHRAGRTRWHFFFLKALGIALPAFLCSFVAPNAHAVAISIDSATIIPNSLDDSGQPELPYFVAFGVSVDAYVTIGIKNVAGIQIRQLLFHTLEVAETTSFHGVKWDGLDDSGLPVPAGLYSFVFDANDAASNAAAPEKTVTYPVTNPAPLSSAIDPKKLFEVNSFVYPNPIRNGQALFNFASVRDNSTITLKIYTLSGDLVLDETLVSGAPALQAYTWPGAGFWNVTNKSGSKLGRGLYYCVFHEKDNVGDLQTVKKMAVIQ